MRLARGTGTARAGVGVAPSGGPTLDQQTWNEYQERVTALVQGYRMRGHRFADLDPPIRGALTVGRPIEG